MRKHLVLLMVVVMLLSTGGALALPVEAVALPELQSFTVSLKPVADARLKPDAGNSGLDYSMDTYFTTKNERTDLMKFDLSSLPAGVQITNANLKIYCTGTSQNPSSVDIRRVLSPWVEGTGDWQMKGTNGATWLTTDGVNPWKNPGGDMDPEIYATTNIVAKAWNHWDITGLVQKWADGTHENNGLAIIESPSAIHAYSYFSTKDSSSNPVLEITYQAKTQATADFSALVSSGVAPLAVKFTESTSPQALAWQWDFNSDGTIDSTVQNPSYSYAAAGTYAVTLKATFPDGSQKTVKKDNLIMVTAAVGAHSVSLTPLADARLKPDAGNSGLDYSMDTYFTTKNMRTSLVKFDLSGLSPNAQITSAKLKIYCTGSSQNQSVVDIRRVLSPWVEGTGDWQMKGINGATWLTTDGVKSWTSPGGDMDPTIYATTNIVPKVWNEWDVTRLAQEWATGAHANNGLAVIESPSAIHAYSYFSTKDSSNKPVLEITYNGDAQATANFSASVSSGVAPLTVNFTESTSPQAVAWQWDFNSDGTVDSTSKSPSYSYATVGTYSVTLKATFPDGTTKTVMKNNMITVTAPSQAAADFKASVTSGTAPLAVQFTELTSPQATGWQWDFDSNGKIDSTAKSPSFSYATAGTYSVTLKATFPDGTTKTVKKDNLIKATAANSRIFEVGVDKPYKRIIDVDTQNLLPGDTVYIYAKPDNAPYKEKIFVRGVGTPDKPIRIIGVPNAAGQLPILDGNGAISRMGRTYWNEDRAVLMFGQDRNGSIPQYVSIENLKITGAAAQNPYTGNAYGDWIYNWNAAGVWIAAGNHVSLVNCDIYGNENGIFSSSCQEITIDKCYVHDNGVHTGSDQEHNFYLNGGPGSKAIIQHCHIGKELNDGQQFKSRVETLVFRYNWIEGGKNSQMDLVEDAANGVSDAWVYGNVIIKPEVTNNGRIIHFGGDNSSVKRTGTLYFFNNTVINKAKRSVNIFQINETGANVVAKNNIFYTPGTYGMNLYDTYYMLGTISGSNNWATETITGLEKLTDTIKGKDPLFASFSGTDFHLTAASGAVNKGLASLPSGIQLLEQYVKHQNSEQRPVNGALDIGAYEFVQ